MFFSVPLYTIFVLLLTCDESLCVCLNAVCMCIEGEKSSSLTLSLSYSLSILSLLCRFINLCSTVLCTCVAPFKLSYTIEHHLSSVNSIRDSQTNLIRIAHVSKIIIWSANPLAHISMYNLVIASFMHTNNKTLVSCNR